MSEKKVEIKRIGTGLNSLAKVNCKDYNGNTVFQNDYVITVLTLDNVRDDIIQAILDDIRAIKGKYEINEVTMSYEDVYGDPIPFFEMDDCENVLFQPTREDKIKQACEELDHKKEKLWDEYATKFGLLPISDCGEYYAEDILALNQWYETESKRLIQEWTDAVNRA